MTKFNSPEATELLLQVEDITNKYSQITEMLQESFTTQNNLSSLTKRLEAMTEAELVEAYQALNSDTGWQKLPAMLDDIICKLQVATTEQPQSPDYLARAQESCTLGNCPDGPSQVEVDNYLIAVAALELTTAVAQATADTIAIFLEKAGKIAQAIASGLDVVAKTLAVVAAKKQRDADVVAECEDNAVKQLLLGMCNTLNTIDSKVDKIMSKVNQIDQKIDILLELVNQIKEVVDELLLHQIESALAECMMLVGLYLPESSFGSLEKVQKIIETLINYSKAAGLIVANAESNWKQGSVALTKGQYQRALQWFMLAYQELQNKEICKVSCPSKPCKE